MLTKKRIISLDVSTGSYAEFENCILNSAKSGISDYVCVANVHMLIEAYNSKEFRDIVNNAALITPDGMPLALSVKLLHGSKQDRVDGMSLLPNLINGAIQKDISVYFYGGTQQAINNTQKYISEQYPELKVAGMYSPPFRQLNKQEEQEIVDTINNSKAQLLFVALGCPKQEKWMASMKGRINCTMIGIGGALPVFIGMQKRAPKWLQQLSLEWVFRLMQEPKRLFKRYLHTNSMFLYLLHKELVNKYIFKSNKPSSNLKMASHKK